MSTDISKLEQAWLQAEALADKARLEAEEARKVAERKKKVASAEGGEITVLLSTMEQLNERHAAAERRASELFDRLWTAKELGRTHA
jgi:hypothetical protein